MISSDSKEYEEVIDLKCMKSSYSENKISAENGIVFLDSLSQEEIDCELHKGLESIQNENTYSADEVNVITENMFDLK